MMKVTDYTSLKFCYIYFQNFNETLTNDVVNFEQPGPGKLTYQKPRMTKLCRVRRLSAEFAFAAYPVWKIYNTFIQCYLLLLV